MYQGQSLEQLALEITRQQAAKRDMIADTPAMHFTPKAERLEIDGQGDFALNDLAHRQIGTWAKIPSKFYDRLRGAHPDLLADTVNTLLEREPARRMVRTLGGTARAFLSDRYHRIDHHTVMEMALATLRGTGLDLQVGSCQVTERRLYLKIQFPQIEAAVKVGDTVRSGLAISNSEVGEGAYSVAPFIERLICLNGMVINDLANKRTHLGRAADERDGAYTLYEDDTLQADDKALMLKLRDTINAMADLERFNGIVKQMQASTEDHITGDPIKAVEVLSQRIGLAEQESGSVLNHLISGGDLTRWGLLNAVTRTSQDAQGYDRATELEADGGRILNLPARDWQQIAEAA